MQPATATTAAVQPAGALSHLRVLDLSRVLAGPLASQVLGDLGADILKIERPGVGDDTRGWGPPYLPDAAGQPSETAAYFACTNRNKRSITLDFTAPEGQRLLHALVPHCDVVIENFKVGGLKPYRLDYDSLKALNPKLIYCSVTGFGQTGPYAPRAGYDFLIQGLGGLMSVTGQPDGTAGAGPMKVGVALTDVMTGLYAAIAVLTAVTHRERTGEGQYIDLALLDVGVAGLANQALSYLSTGQSPQRLGNAHPSVVPYQDFPTADGHMILAIGNDGQFARFCAEAGQPALAGDVRYATNAARVRHRDTLIPTLRELTGGRTTQAWITALERCSVPCGPINTLAEVFDDPHVRARGLQMALPDERLGSIPSVASPLRLSATPVSYRHAPPALGAHTGEVLAELLGLAPDQLEALRTQGVI
ncbi:MAG: CaiB/BaiF CoA-transferase family protein [Burkholderiales bacterium]